MVRKIIIYIATSVDSYIADTNGNIDWLDSQYKITKQDDSYETFCYNRHDYFV